MSMERELNLLGSNTISVLLSTNVPLNTEVKENLVLHLNSVYPESTTGNTYEELLIRKGQRDVIKYLAKMCYKQRTGK